MPLQGGYDIQLGSQKFLLDETAEAPYDHGIEVIQVDSRILGNDQAELVQPKEGEAGRLIWEMTDWSGGEGAQVFDPRYPTMYDKGDQVNTRIPGQFTGRPKINSVNVAVSNLAKHPTLTQGGGVIWLACDQTLKISTDQGDTFGVNATGALGLGGGYSITSVAGNTEGVYVASYNGTNRQIHRVKYGGGVPTASTVLTAVAGVPFVGLVFLNGSLYGWTGKKLFQFDTTAAFPLVLDSTYLKVHDTGNELDYSNFGGSSPGSWWGDVVVSENSVFYFIGLEGQTYVYEYDSIAGVEAWHVAFGFTGKSLVQQNGNLLVAGHWVGDSGATEGYGSLKILPLDSRIPLEGGSFRRWNDQHLQMQEMANSYDSQSLVAAANGGYVFVYDGLYNSISLLDRITLTANEKLGGMLTSGRRRLVTRYQPQGAPGAGNAVVYSYKSDDEAFRENAPTTGTLVSSQYDFGYPYDTKILHGFHVAFRPMAANKTITIKYSIDNGDNYTTLTAISSATAGNSKGRVFLPVGSVEFYRLKVKCEIDGTAVLTPAVYAIAAEVDVLNFRDVWKLAIRVKDEAQKRGAPSDRAKSAEEIRDLLWTLLETRAPVSFIDGARYSSKPNKVASTETVIVTEVHDIIPRTGNNQDRSAEGTMYITLKSKPE